MKPVEDGEVIKEAMTEGDDVLFDSFYNNAFIKSTITNFICHEIQLQDVWHVFHVTLKNNLRWTLITENGCPCNWMSRPM